METGGQTPTLYATIGLPASGKSTTAHRMVEASNGTVTEISKDALRLNPQAPQDRRAQEKWVLQEEDRIIRAALSAGKSIVVHDTNLNPYHAQRLESLAEEHNATLQWLDFRHVSLEECIERDSNRENAVGRAVILDMHKRYLAPKQRHRAQSNTQAKNKQQDVGMGR